MQAVLDLPQTESKNVVDKQMFARQETTEKVLLHGISWEVYESLLRELTDKSKARIDYDNGCMEIFMESAKHGKYAYQLQKLADEIAVILEFDVIGLGNVTFKKEKKKKGFEPDGCFYFENAALMRTVDVLDLEIHPAPELIIEVDVTSLSLPRFPIFAAIGVLEVWRFDGETVKFHRLQDDETYLEIEESVCLPKVKSESVTKLLEAGFELSRKDWLKIIRQSI